MKIIDFDDLDDGAHPIDIEVPNGYQGFTWQEITDAGTVIGNLYVYSEAEYTNDYGYNPSYPSGSYAARLAASTTECNLRVTPTITGSFTFLGAQFHGIGFTWHDFVHWAETVDLVGKRADGSTVGHIGVPITHAHGSWTSISFPDMTNLVSLDIYGKTSAGNARNAMWIMDDFKVEEYRQGCRCLPKLLLQKLFKRKDTTIDLG